MKRLYLEQRIAIVSASLDEDSLKLLPDMPLQVRQWILDLMLVLGGDSTVLPRLRRMRRRLQRGKRNG